MKRVALFLLAIVVTISATFSISWMRANIAFLQEEKRILEEHLAERGAQLALAKKLDVRANLQDRYWWPEPPHFIFSQKNIAWDVFTKYLPEHIDAAAITPRVISSFQAGNASRGTDISGISSTGGELVFPGSGEYYLHTNVGHFKILILDPAAGEDENIMAAATFVTRNIIHSTADHPPILDKDAAKTLAGKLFLSDQPLFLWCAEGSRVLNSILSRMGYSARQILLADDALGGHSVSEAFFPGIRKWGMIDEDFGTYFVDAQTGIILDTTEAAHLLKSSPKRLETRFLVKKNPIREDFNQSPYTPRFSWTPDKMRNVPPITAAEYISLMQKLTNRITILQKRPDSAPEKP